MEKETERISESGSSKWNWFGRKFPKREAVFFTQVNLIYIVITFQEIAIVITDYTGERVPFEQGRVILKLRFGKK